MDFLLSPGQFCALLLMNYPGVNDPCTVDWCLPSLQCKTQLPALCDRNRGQSLRGDYKAIPLAIFPFPSCTRVVLQIGLCSLACGEQWFKPGRQLRLLIGFIFLSSVI